MRQVKLSDLHWEDRFTYKKIVPFTVGDSKFQIVKFDKGKNIMPHYHLYTDEIFYILSGKGTLYINGFLYPLDKNHTYHIQPGDWHGIKAETKLTIAIFKPQEGKDDIFWK